MSNQNSSSPLQPIVYFNDEDEDMGHLVKEYQNQGINVLSMINYNYLVQRGLQIIHAPQPIQYKLNKFLGSQELFQVDKILVDKLEKEQKWQPYSPRLIKNNSQHIFRGLSDQKYQQNYIIWKNQSYSWSIQKIYRLFLMERNLMIIHIKLEKVQMALFSILKLMSLKLLELVQVRRCQASTFLGKNYQLWDAQILKRKIYQILSF